MQVRRNAGVIAVALLLAGRSASGQYLSSVGIERPAAASMATHVVLVPGLSAEGSRAAGAAHGALIGAGIGAAVGVVVVAVTPHSDHSEDTLGYIVGAAGGAFVGLVVGATIGARHPR